MKKFLLFLISLLVGIGLFIWTLKSVGVAEIRSAFSVFNGWQGLVILGLTVLIAILGTFRWQEILKGENVKVPFRDLLKPYLAGFSVMFLAPIMIWGGEIFRGFTLKEKNSVPWAKGMASVITDRILEWTANLVVIFFGVLFFLDSVCLPPKKLGIVFGTVFLLFAVAIGYFYFKVSKRESLIKIIAGILGFKKIEEKNAFLETENEIFNFFKAKNRAMWSAFALSFLRAIVMWFRALLLIFFLGKSLGALPSLSILGFNYLAMMIPIPTALGSHEAIQSFAFNSLGLGVSTATAFTMIIRGAELTIALAGLVFLFKQGIESLRNRIFKRVKKIRKIIHKDEV